MKYAPIAAISVPLVLIVAGLAAAAIVADEPPKTKTPEPSTPAAVTPCYAPKPLADDRILELARDYTKWKRVSDSAHYAPQLCRAPFFPSGTQQSVSGDDATHGKKLYFLFAAKDQDYVKLNWSDKPATAPVGQTIVKETFAPVEVPLDQVPKEGKAETDGRVHPAEYLIDKGKAFKTGEKRDLFIMTKLDPETLGSDKGWVYATVTADGSKVTQSGAIASCIECHQHARHDRLFGLPMAQRLTEIVKEREKKKAP